jgi:hypothetical protein
MGILIGKLSPRTKRPLPEKLLVLEQQDQKLSIYITEKPDKNQEKFYKNF